MGRLPSVPLSKARERESYEEREAEENEKKAGERREGEKGGAVVLEHRARSPAWRTAAQGDGVERSCSGPRQQLGGIEGRRKWIWFVWHRMQEGGGHEVAARMTDGTNGLKSRD